MSFRIGLVIDMTATSKYYYPSEIYSAGVDYYKLPIPGADPIFMLFRRKIFVHKAYFDPSKRRKATTRRIRPAIYARDRLVFTLQTEGSKENCSSKSNWIGRPQHGRCGCEDFGSRSGERLFRNDGKLRLHNCYSLHSWRQQIR